ncbi:hypothetical protein ACFSYD_10060 [Paracoccus aerius]
MRQRLRRHIVLIGMMGAGKTALGSELARRLHVPFTDRMSRSRQRPPCPFPRSSPATARPSSATARRR